MISLKEIGRICGLAESTVSKALKNNPGIKAGTRERVWEVAKRYNYQPNAMVECLQRGSSRSIGIAYNNFRDGFAGSIMHGIISRMDEAGYEIMVVSWDMIVARGAHLLSRFSRRRVDGLLLFPMAQLPTPDYLGELRAMSMPIAVIDQTWPGNEFNFIGSDNEGGAALATRRLIELGLKRLGCVRNSGVSTGVERWEGFLAEMRRHGLPVADELCPDVAGALDYDFKAVKRLLSSKERPEGLVCFNDYCALNALKAARELGIEVPRELSIIGFGDLPLAGTLSDPALSTIDQSPEEIGRKAAETLLAAIDGSLKERTELRLPVRLVERASTAKTTSKKGTGL